VSREIERLKSKEHEGESKVDRDKQSKDRSEDVSEDVGEVARLTKEVHNEVHKQTEGVSEQGGVKQSDVSSEDSESREIQRLTSKHRRELAERHLQAALLLDPAMAMVRVDLAQNLLLSGQATRALSLLDEALLLARQVSEIRDVAARTIAVLLSLSGASTAARRRVDCAGKPLPIPNHLTTN